MKIEKIRLYNGRTLEKNERTCIHHEKKNPWGVASAGAHSSAHRMWLELGLRGLF